MRRAGWHGRAARALSVALLGSGLAAGVARAALSGAPGLEIAGCPPAWDREIRRAVTVELGAAGVDAGADPPLASPGEGASANTLSVRCAYDRVVVEARARATGAPVVRTLGLDELPPVTAPRVIALAAVELLAALDPELRRRLSSAVSAAQRPLVAGDRGRLSLVAGGVYRAFLAPDGLHAWGGALDGRRASASGAWSFDLGVEVAGGDRAARLGQTSALLASFRASAGVRARLADGALALTLDLGGRAGVARLTGRTDDRDVQTSTAVRPWAGPVAVVGAQVGLSRLCVQLAAEGGWAAVSATGLVEDKAALAASGAWVAVSLGLGLRGR